MLSYRYVWSVTLDMDVGAEVVNNYAWATIYTMRYFICILNTLLESVSAFKRWKIRGGEYKGGDMGISMHGELMIHMVLDGAKM